MRISGIVALYVEESQRKKQVRLSLSEVPQAISSQIALFNLDVNAAASITAEVRLIIVKPRKQLTRTQNGAIRGSIVLEKFELVKRFGELGVTKTDIDDIAILSSQFIEKMLNELFTTGFPLPVPSGTLTDRFNN